MKIIAAEDDPILADGLAMMLEKMGYQLVGMSDNGAGLLELWRTQEPDIALIDIHLNGELDGIEVAQQINDSARAIPIIFLTAFTDERTFRRAKALNPHAYLQKPFDELTLERAIELALYRHIRQSQEAPAKWQGDLATPQSFFVKVGDFLRKVEVNAIHFVEVEGKHSLLHTEHGKFSVRMPLREIQENLPATQFVQTHRNFVVNLQRIQVVNLKANTLEIKSREVPVSKSYRDELLGRLNTIN